MSLHADNPRAALRSVESGLQILDILEDGSRLGQFGDLLDTYKAGKTNHSSLLLRGIVPPITEDYEFLAERIAPFVRTVGGHLGIPYREIGESNDLVQDIIPNPKKRWGQTSKNSKEELYLHMENPGVRVTPDWLVLGCVRNFERAETTIVDPAVVLNTMVEKGLETEVERLAEPMFWIEEPQIFAERAKRARAIVKTDVPVIKSPVQYPFDRPNIDFDLEAMGSESSEHQEVLRVFHEQAKELQTAITLQTGDILILRNTGEANGIAYRSCIHGRRAFSVARKPRWLKRLHVVQDGANRELF